MFRMVLGGLAVETRERDGGRVCFNCARPVGFALDDDRCRLIWQPLWLLAGPDDQVTVACQGCADPFPIVREERPVLDQPAPAAAPPSWPWR
ncbi:hypothetical protein GCM10009609_35330 [Pseudonocardia aurantiaca]